jgi:hypothetical protein
MGSRGKSGKRQERNENLTPALGEASLFFPGRVPLRFWRNRPSRPDLKEGCAMKIYSFGAATISLALFLLFGVPACSQWGQRPEGEARSSPALFEELKKLSGRWETGDADKDGKPDGVVVYRVTSGGSAVEETIFPGSPHEMVTLYNQDNGKLEATHYCMLGNEPRLEAVPESTPRKLVFRFKEGMNMDPGKDEYMGQLIMTIPDADHLKQEWSSFKAGKMEKSMVFEYQRVKS